MTFTYKVYEMTLLCNDYDEAQRVTRAMQVAGFNAGCISPDFGKYGVIVRNFDADKDYPRILSIYKDTE